MRGRIPAAGFKETISVMFMAFGISMAVVMMVCILNFLMENAYIGSFHVGEFLFLLQGRGFELPFFLAIPFNFFLEIHQTVANFLINLLGGNGGNGGITDNIYFFAFNPFLEEVEWRGIFWLTRKHSSKRAWKILFLVSCFLFALIHNKGIGWMMGPFAIAATSGIIIARTKRFWPAAVNHALVNGTIAAIAHAVK